MEVACSRRLELPTLCLEARGQSYENLPEAMRMKQNQQIAANRRKLVALSFFTGSSQFAAFCRKLYDISMIVEREQLSAQDEPAPVHSSTQSARFSRSLRTLMDLPRWTLPVFRLVDSSAVTLTVIFNASTLYGVAVRMRFASFDRVSAEL
jgi:hypothetical protein